MLEAPGRVLPRPMSLCQAPPGELAFLIDPIGPGTRALCALEPGAAIHVFGPLGNGFDLDVARPLLVAGGGGMRPGAIAAGGRGGRRGEVRPQSRAFAVTRMPRSPDCFREPRSWSSRAS